MGMAGLQECGQTLEFQTEITLLPFTSTMQQATFTSIAHILPPAILQRRGDNHSGLQDVGLYPHKIESHL